MSLGPLPPVPNWLRVVISGVVDGTTAPWPWANVIHFEYSGSAPSNATCALIADAAHTAWATFMAPACPSPTKLTRVVVTDLTSDSAGEGEWVGSEPGTRGDDSIPANAALLISYPAATRYRGGHPRTYLYVLGNADLTGAASWTSAATAEVLADWQQFLTNLVGSTISGTTITEFGFIRYYGKFLPNSGAPRYRLDSPIPSVVSIGSAIGHEEIASQRRRVGRRKR